MDQEILATLEEAENTVSKLKALIEGNPTEAATSSSSPAGAAVEPASKEGLYRRSYMTLSATKLFENRGEEVFRIADSVGLYFIVPNTRVRTAARSAVLRLVRIAEEYQDASHPPAFVQVGDWVYPLLPGSMVYRSEHKYYLFPDLLSTTPGTSVGVVLPKSCAPEERAEFERLLLSFVGMDEFPPRPPDNYGKSTDLILNARTSVELVRTKSGVYSQRQSTILQQAPQIHWAGGVGGEEERGAGYYGRRIGQGIKAGGELLSAGLELGAIGTANAIGLGASCLKRTLTPAGNDVEIPGAVVNGMAYAKGATDTVVDISATIVETLCEITSNFAALTACYIRATAAPLVEKIVEASGIPPETIDYVAGEAKDLGEGIQGAGMEAYRGLANAACIMAKSLSDNTAEVVTHCYGPSAARVLQNAGEVVGNVAISGLNASQLTDPGRMAKQTVKKTGLAVCTGDCASN